MAAAELEVEWKIIPKHAPVVTRRCARCDAQRSFSSSGKFRINASGRKLDVWLIYKCHACKQTWNATVLSRVAPESIDPDLYQRYLSNDAETALAQAFNYDFLKRNEAEFDPKIEYSVDGPEIPESARSGTARIHVRFVYPISVRLETLLANQLGISRSRLEKLHDSGALALDDGAKLSKKMKPELHATLDLAALAEARAK